MEYTMKTIEVNLKTEAIEKLLTNHNRPCIWTHPIPILLPGLSWTITASSTSANTIIQFILSTKVSSDGQICGTIKCIFTFWLSYVNLDNTPMEIFVIEPVHRSWSCMWILIGDRCITLWFIGNLVPIYPNFWMPSPLVLLCGMTTEETNLSWNEIWKM